MEPAAHPQRGKRIEEVRMKKKICFIGPGTMGMGMARNLAAGEDSCLVIGRNAEKLRPLKDSGIPVSTTLRDAADSDVIFLCLPDTEAVMEVLLDDETGLLDVLREGQVIVDCSTIDYFSAQELGEMFEEQGIEYIDAPVSGHREKAADGTLTIMCGGNRSAFDDVKPLLDRMGTTVLYMGGHGAGQLTKMINNCALDICAASFCELMPVGVKLGLEPEKLGEVLMTASGSSYASKTLIPEVLEGNFEHGFTMEKAYKDLTSMARVTSEFAIPLPTLSGTLQTYQLALQTGQGDNYKGAMIRFFEDLLDVRCRKAPAETE